MQGRLGIIPADAAQEIERQCRIENIDFAKLKAQTERIGYPILGVVPLLVLSRLTCWASRGRQGVRAIAPAAWPPVAWASAWAASVRR